MSQAPKARWGESLREAVVVIASILIAFGLDAAWDARREAVERQAALASLHADFVAADSIAKGELERIARVKESVGYLLGLVQSQRQAPADSVGRAILSLQMKGDFGYPTGAYEALAGSGRLSLIEDTQLRKELAGFVGFLDLLREIHLVETQQWLEIHEPFWTAHTDLYPLYQRAYADFPSSPSRFDAGFSEVLSLRETSNVLSYRWDTVEATKWAVETALGRIDSILDLVNEQQEG